MLLVFVGMAILRQKTDDTVLLTDLTKIPPKEEIDERVKRDVLQKPVEIQDTEITENPMIIYEEVEISDMVETPDESETQETHGEDGLTSLFEDINMGVLT